MYIKGLRFLSLTLFTLFVIDAYLGRGQAQQPGKRFTPTIPRTWDDQAMASLEVPLADASASPVHVQAEYYYRIPIRSMYKSYPVYVPGREPAGYQEWLKGQEPELAFDAAKLKTEADWIKAGEMVFDAPIFYNAVVTAENVRDPQWHEKIGAPLAKDGTMPWFRYVVREKGKVELGTISCGMCHTRVLPDGSIVKGAQGNFPFERSASFGIRQGFNAERARNFARSFFSAPWIKPDPMPELGQITTELMADWTAAIPPGVIGRQGSNPMFPPQTPDLIGVKERKYLDHTGLQLHRSPVDMMRYAALNQGADLLSSYGGYIPAARDTRTRPDAAKQLRYSDEQLYALSLYIYSLKPPPNPHKFDAAARRGQQIFKREGCAVCHTSPLYTNNKLTPVDGFAVPAEHMKNYDIMSSSIGTDPALALKTRRGTGYYKVPSLKGVWYRGPFEHNGSVLTLEDWFDACRLEDNYVPTGFRGVGVVKRAVKGHPFGLRLSADERGALIAFLKTL